MEIIKNILSKILNGFLIGIGFIIAAGLLGSYAVSHITSAARESSNLNSDITKDREELKDMFKEYDESAQLTAVVNTERIGNGEFTLLGEITNNGSFSWQMINLQADLYNTKGQFIEQCTEYVSETLRPGETANFKLSCRSSNCNTVDVNGFESYKLKIADARYMRDTSAK